VAFANLTDVDALAARYGLNQRREPFVRPVVGSTFSPATRDDIDLALTGYPIERSEIAAREALIFPILKDVWRHYRADLTMLSGESLEADADLRGELDYMVCRRAAGGALTPGVPILLVGEAERDDKSVGWAQALGGMLAARMLGGPEITYHGLATTGTVWRFGRLTDNEFVRDPITYGLNDLDALAGALHFVFTACRDQVLAHPLAAA
jgi:hypothetical protein